MLEDGPCLLVDASRPLAEDGPCPQVEDGPGSQSRPQVEDGSGSQSRPQVEDGSGSQVETGPGLLVDDGPSCPSPHDYPDEVDQGVLH